MLIGRRVLGTADWVRFVLSYGATVRHQPDGLDAAVLALTARPTTKTKRVYSPNSTRTCSVSYANRINDDDAVVDGTN